MTEQQPFQIVRSYDGFEVRRYSEHLLAEVLVEGAFEDAGNLAFRYLFAYINGENQANQKVPMTAPVVQDAAPEKISMTAPVLQQAVEGQGDDCGTPKFRIAFVLPEGFTIESAPWPTNPRVHLRTVPESLAAVIRFNGRWSNVRYQQHLQSLRTALREAGLASIGAPRFARFDPPFKPWWLRHNEIVLDLPESDQDGAGYSSTQS
ncbi:heme-binding protein [Arthrobacter alpinus]|uniref:Heme-binding protein n=1 Tax=Arthrobacter alpinus TaxID=656366 RepID=A0A0M4QFN3_9MICC|nr:MULTISPECIES: heme-binding protein [Arthrobacter]ALE92342.1 heme-binding protein [Arthrobacter alpinus]